MAFLACLRHTYSVCLESDFLLCALPFPVCCHSICLLRVGCSVVAVQTFGIASRHCCLGFSDLHVQKVPSFLYHPCLLCCLQLCFFLICYLACLALSSFLLAPFCKFPLFCVFALLSATVFQRSACYIPSFFPHLAAGISWVRNAFPAVS